MTGVSVHVAAHSTVDAAAAMAVVAGAAAIGWLYLRGARRARRHRRLLLVAALAVVVVALGPLDALAHHSAAAHMVQHLALTSIAPPLVALAAPVPALLRGLPVAPRRTASRVLRRALDLSARPAAPVAAAAVHAGVLLAWHVPAAYDAALASAPVHATEHVTLLVTALAVWWLVADPHLRQTPARLGSIAALALLAAVGTAIGLALTMSTVPWYDVEAPVAFGLDRLADQQAAGALLWSIGGAVGAGGAFLLTLRFLSHAPADAR